MSALSELFGNIAAAIREKSGETGTMKPAEFPDKIAAIEGVKDPELLFASGEIQVTSTDAITIQHDLGVIPDIVVVFLCGLNGSTTISYDSSVLTGEVAYSAEAMADGAQRYVYYANGSNLAVAVGMYETDSVLDAWGCVREATLSTFKIGGSTALPLCVGADYRWAAIGGIKTHPTYLHVVCSLDGNGNLIVTGGVSEISQLEIYVDGTLAKTVDYVHGEEFIVDISDVATESREYTVSVIAFGDNLEDAYPYRFYEPVTDYVLLLGRGTCGDGVTWLLTTDGNMIISGEGAMYDYAAQADVPWADHVADIKSATIADGITHIGAYAFSQAAAMETISIPDSVQSFGKYVFFNCQALTGVTIPDGVTALPKYFVFRCAAITSIVIPSSVKSIGSYAFGNTGLTSATFKDYSGWYVTATEGATSGTSVTVSNTSTAATLLKTTHYTKFWYDKT